MLRIIGKGKKNPPIGTEQGTKFSSHQHLQTLDQSYIVIVKFNCMAEKYLTFY